MIFVAGFSPIIIGGMVLAGMIYIIYMFTVSFGVAANEVLGDKSDAAYLDLDDSLSTVIASPFPFYSKELAAAKYQAYRDFDNGVQQIDITKYRTCLGADTPEESYSEAYKYLKENSRFAYSKTEFEILSSFSSFADVVEYFEKKTQEYDISRFRKSMEKLKESLLDRNIGYSNHCLQQMSEDYQIEDEDDWQEAMEKYILSSEISQTVGPDKKINVQFLYLRALADLEYTEGLIEPLQKAVSRLMDNYGIQPPNHGVDEIRAICENIEAFLKKMGVPDSQIDIWKNDKQAQREAFLCYEEYTAYLPKNLPEVTLDPLKDMRW